MQKIHSKPHAMKENRQKLIKKQKCAKLDYKIWRDSRKKNCWVTLFLCAGQRPYCLYRSLHLVIIELDHEIFH